MIETGDITQTYVTDTILITNQSTTVTNWDQIARQIEAAYGLPVGSVRITSITINGISTNAGNGRRRRGELYRKKRQLSTCDQFGLARSAVQITMRIAYPRRCGVAPACKQRFLNNVLTLFNTFTSSFPATFIFANGRSVQLVLYPCRATGAFPFIVGGAGGARITTTTRAPVCSLQWNPAGTTVAGDGTAGVGAQQLNLPTDVFLASANTLFIVCTGASRVQRWTIGATQGVTVAGQADGSAGGNPNQLSNPTGVVVDRNGNIYVTDTVPGRIQLWPPGAAAGQTIAAGKIA
ncbi:unnamed protein product [Rotaria sordida]|uniref:NHL repeat-containing protein n=1 Tax=Rotaria sordida TaxID=392033 RepID=A0A815KG34_9BILA|nr:unnamed protein product [Rotaria sordida]CAF1395726.1 unnamed protein product [Rotaria sordida]